MMNIK
jgi:hypothetical protein